MAIKSLFSGVSYFNSRFSLLTGSLFCMFLSMCSCTIAECIVPTEALLRGSFREIEPISGSLVGESARVFVDEISAKAIEAGQTLPADMIVVKAILTTIIEVTQQDWRRARIEVMARSINECTELSEWKFYGLGPSNNLASVGYARPIATCLSCHSKVDYKGSPIFFGYYTHTNISFKKPVFILRNYKNSKQFLLSNK